MPTTSVSEEQVPQKTADIVQNALADALRDQGLIVPSNELQNIKNLVEGQAQALAQGLLDQAAAEEYLAGDEFGQNEETTKRKTSTSQEQEATPTGEEGGEVEQETTREKTPEGTEPAEKPEVPTAGAQPETATPTPQPTLPTGIHAEVKSPEEGAFEAPEPGEVVPPDIAEMRSKIKDEAFEVPPEAPETPPTSPQKQRPQPKEKQQSERPPKRGPQQPQEAPPQEEPVPGAPSGDITPPEEAPDESKEKEKPEAPKQESAPESEEQKAAETKKAQQQALMQQEAQQTTEATEAEKELKTLQDKARQFGPSLGKIMIPFVDIIQEFLPLLDTGFIAGVVSVVTTASKVLWFLSQGPHLKEFIWEKARKRFAISAIIEVIPWLNWIPAVWLTDFLTLREVRNKQIETTTQIDALTQKIKTLTARR